MAEASLFVHNLDHKIYTSHTQPMLSHINVGRGTDVTIKELAEIVKEVIGFKGELVFDTTKPDGTPRKLMDVSLLSKLGWTAKTSLYEGLKASYKNFLENIKNLRW